MTPNNLSLEAQHAFAADEMTEWKVMVRMNADKVATIKNCRSYHNIGLKPAKDAVEAYANAFAQGQLPVKVVKLSANLELHIVETAPDYFKVTRVERSEEYMESFHLYQYIADETRKHFTRHSGPRA